jgi:hypothetical protein
MEYSMRINKTLFLPKRFFNTNIFMDSFGAKFNAVIRRTFHSCLILFVTLIFNIGITSKVAAQNATIESLPSIIFSLFDSRDSCVIPIGVGNVKFSQLDPRCKSELLGDDHFAKYFTFAHNGGPLHLDLLSDFPNGFDTYLALRRGNGRNGALVESETNDIANGFDNDGHSDLSGSRLIYSNLIAASYTVETTANDPNTAGSFSLAVYGDRVTAKKTGRLNDTGVTISATVVSDCGLSSVVQDCDLGRDADPIIGLGDANDNDGINGFSFLKVAANGQPLLEDASQWSCVKDNVTGLMWEVKQDQAGLHSENNTYSWYNTDLTKNGGSSGIANNGVCTGSRCDTQSFAAAVNMAGLCGYNDWRLPNENELLGIVDFNDLDLLTGLERPRIDHLFFSETENSSFYWTVSPVSFNTSNAWGVRLYSGGASISISGRGTGNKVRLVRGRF